MMGKPGMTVSRWIDGVLEKNDLIDQDSNIRGDVLLGPCAELADARARDEEGDGEARSAGRHRPVSVGDGGDGGDAQGRGSEVRRQPEPRRYLLPAATQFETEGSVTASNRSIQWREKVIEPLFESRTDHTIMYPFAQKLGFADQFLGKKDGKQQHAPGQDGEGRRRAQRSRTSSREINGGSWTIGYTGQSPERLQAHMRNMHVFDVKTLRAKGGKDAKTGYDLTGDYFGLPWPCYGNAALKHPGSPNLYQTSRNVMDGGGNFRANFGVEKRRREPARRGRLGVAWAPTSPPAIRSSTTSC